MTLLSQMLVNLHSLQQITFNRVFLFPSCLPEDDVDLEALVNDMNSSLESLYSTCSGQQTDSTLLLQNGQTSASSQQHHNHHRPSTHHTHVRQGHHVLSHSSPEPPSSMSTDLPQASLRRSQPMHILAVR